MATSGTSEGDGTRTRNHWIDSHKGTGEIPEKDAGSREGGARNGASDVDPCSIDAGLQALIDVWPALPAALKVGIIAMVRAAGTSTK